MDGGCIDIWLKGSPNAAIRNQIIKYRIGIGKYVASFNIKIDYSEVQNWFERIQIKSKLGYNLGTKVQI